MRFEKSYRIRLGKKSQFEIKISSVNKNDHLTLKVLSKIVTDNILKKKKKLFIF